jgi:hypothetical protein
MVCGTISVGFLEGISPDELLTSEPGADGGSLDASLGGESDATFTSVPGAGAA